jgi:hypothetical protein
MNSKQAKQLVYLFCFAILLTSCSGTEIVEKQLDDAYTGKPVSNILIIAITGNEHNRRSFEKRFVAHLHQIGIGAVSSEEVIPMPPDLKMEREAIMDAVNQFKNDAVIVTHLMDKEVEDVYTRGTSRNRGFHVFYSSRYNYSYDRGYSSTSTSLRLETNLYDVKTDKLIWSGKSKTWSKDSAEQIISDVVKALIDTLRENELIAPSP